MTDDTPRDPLAALRRQAEDARRLWGEPDIRPSMVLFVDDVDWLLDATRPSGDQPPFPAYVALLAENDAMKAALARPSGDGALTEERIEAAIQSAYDHHDDHRKRHPGHTGECQDDWPAAHRLAPLVRAALAPATGKWTDDRLGRAGAARVRAALATPSSTPDVEGPAATDGICGAPVAYCENDAGHPGSHWNPRVTDDPLFPADRPEWFGENKS